MYNLRENCDKVYFIREDEIDDIQIQEEIEKMFEMLNLTEESLFDHIVNPKDYSLSLAGGYLGFDEFYICYNKINNYFLEHGFEPADMIIIDARP